MSNESEIFEENNLYIRGNHMLKVINDIKDNFDQRASDLLDTGSQDLIDTK